MRSHSRLDFYAKSLAVAGLGCLGAIGALIDGWPQQGPLPEVAALNDFTAAPVEPMAADAVVLASATSVSISRAAFAMSPTPALRASFEPSRRPASLVPQRVAFVRFSIDVDQADVTEPAGTGDLPSLPVADAGTLRLPVETITTLAVAEDDEESWDAAPDPVMALAQVDEGILSGLTGVLRKAGSGVGAVGNTLTKAGGAAVGAFRVVGGAMTGAVRRIF